MNKIIIFTFFLAFTMQNAFGQFSKDEAEIQKIIAAQETIPRTVFLDSTTLVDMNVKSFNTRQIWFARKDGGYIEQLFDIRIKFENKDSALAFHRKYININSEEGPEITAHNIRSEGADEFMAFKASETISAMVKDYGIQMYCYIFVVDNYFAKVYVSCKLEYKPDEFQELITDIINRIKNNG